MTRKERIVLLSLLLLTILVGCSIQQQSDSMMDITDRISTTDDAVTMNPTLEATLSLDTTVQIPPTISVSEPAEETKCPSQSEETTPPITEPIQPSQGTEPEPELNIPPETENAKPAPPETATTVPPVESSQTEPPHQHSYSEETVAPTCTAAGYTLYTCTCGDFYESDITEPTGHTWSDWIINQEASMWWIGEESRFCDVCSETEYRDIEMIPQDQFTADVEKSLAECISQFRIEEGSTELTFLPGMTQVAKYRSKQLVTNFAHDTNDIREALAYYQYGRYVDPAQFGDPNGTGYYTDDGNEAIGYGPYYGTAKQIAYKMASGVRESTGHWSYVGSSEYSYIGIGCTFENGTWYICVLVGKVNYG